MVGRFGRTRGPGSRADFVNSVNDGPGPPPPLYISVYICQNIPLILKTDKKKIVTLGPTSNKRRTILRLKLGRKGGWGWVEVFLILPPYPLLNPILS